MTDNKYLLSAKKRNIPRLYEKKLVSKRVYAFRGIFLMEIWHETYICLLKFGGATTVQWMFAIFILTVIFFFLSLSSKMESIKTSSAGLSVMFTKVLQCCFFMLPMITKYKTMIINNLCEKQTHKAKKLNE